MQFGGILVGAVTFLLIGAFHPLVIKGEYHFGKKICWAFLAVGVAALAGSVLVAWVELSSILAVLGFTCLWSIKEVFEQVKRVERGWYPKKQSK
ncbi:MAG: DUF4491 family protein [Eubacteriales bacterium]